MYARVKRVESNPQYQGMASSADVALVELEAPVTFTNYIFGLPEAEKFVPADTKTAIMIYMRGMCTEKGREFIDKQLLKIV